MIRGISYRILLGALGATLALGSFATTASADIENGKALYTANCVSCHGETGKGDGPVGSALNPPPRDFSKGDFKFDANGDGIPGEDADLLLVLQKGAAAYGGSPLMAPWGHLPESDLNDLIAYVRSLK